MLTPPATNLRRQLQNSTHTIHQSLHHNPLLSRLMQRDCTRAEYRAILRIFFVFYAQSESHFSNLCHLKFTAEAPVLSWLQQDLTALGDQRPLPQDKGEIAKPADFSHYVGYLYVKQGSTLGGQVLCRHLEKNMGLSPTNGLRFFYGFGEHTRQNWLDVLRYFEERQTAVDVPAAIASACDHFLRLQLLLEKYEH